MRFHIHATERSTRRLALLLALILTFAVLSPAAWAVMPERGDLLRFIPVALSVDDSAVSVYGYFANFNPDCYVSNFRNFEMSVFMDNMLIASGSFTSLENFVIGPEDVFYHTFIYPGRSSLNPGTYICDDNDYATISCTFDYSEMVYLPGGVK